MNNMFSPSDSCKDKSRSRISDCTDTSREETGSSAARNPGDVASVGVMVIR